MIDGGASICDGPVVVDYSLVPLVEILSMSLTSIWLTFYHPQLHLMVDSRLLHPVHGPLPHGHRRYLHLHRIAHHLVGSHVRSTVPSLDTEDKTDCNRLS